MSFTEHHHRLRDGLRLYYRDYGEPRSRQIPVLCLTGLTRNSRDYEDLAPYLAAQGRRVICSDYRGYGRSDRDPEWMHYQIEYDAADAIDLLSRRDLSAMITDRFPLSGICDALALLSESRECGKVMIELPG